MRRLIGKYLSSVTVAGLMTLLVLWINNFDTIENQADRLRVLADAFTVPGVIFMLVAALIWVASDGFFDGIGYAGRLTARMLLPFLKLEDEKYYDYKMRKADNRIHGYSFIFFTGLAFFAVSLVWIALFYAV